MLKSIYIKNYLLISEAHIDFTSGLTAITGETGSGKSLLIDSLGIAMGSRISGNVIRSDCDSADITVLFDVTSFEAKQWLDELGLSEGDECFIRRLIFPDRPTRSYINGRPVTLKSVRSLASLLVEIHGQHEHHSLTKSTTQRYLLDAFVGHLDEVTTLADIAKNIRTEESKRAQLTKQENQLKSSLELTQHQHSELEQLSPEQGEFTRLKADLARASNAEKLIRSLTTISEELFYGYDRTVSSVISNFAVQVSQLSKYEDQLEPIYELLNEAVIRIEESAREMNLLSSRIEHDPAKIENLQSRMSDLYHQARIHQIDVDSLSDLQQELTEKIENLESKLADIEEFDNNLEQLKHEYHSIAKKIQSARRKAAQNFAQDVTQQLQSLGMEGAIFEVSLVDQDSNLYSSFGYEDTKFLIATNPGQEKGSIGMLASGGELSRISLAIQVVATSTTQVPTVVFDEIDVGIGGSVAERVGTLLTKLSRHAQIICITHLPQLAAKGHHQLNVVKSVDHDLNVTIRSLSPQERIKEIARMLGGVKITTRTTEHAKEMLSQCE